MWRRSAAAHRALRARRNAYAGAVLSEQVRFAISEVNVADLAKQNPEVGGFDGAAYEYLTAYHAAGFSLRLANFSAPVAGIDEIKRAAVKATKLNIYAERALGAH